MDERRATAPVAPVRVLAAIALALTLAAGCWRGDETPSVETSRLVYGADDRTEFFALADPDLRARLSGAVVALIRKASIQASPLGLTADVPTWGSAGNLCPGERFADQPAAAFCSGVLVDWDLVLTAGHCVRLFALDDFVVALGYYYLDAGRLALEDVREPALILDEALDPEGAEPRLDYAWLRLRAPVPPSALPAPVALRPAALALGQPIVSMGAGLGVPIKSDSGGQVRDARQAQGDYFVADTDTSHGSSGGGAFDQQLSLVGVFARGGADLAPTDAGCNVTAVEPDGAAAQEQFTYAARAVAELCARDPSSTSLCRIDCGDPCAALPAAPGGGGGCSVSPAADLAIARLTAVGALLLFPCARRRRGKPAQLN